MDLDHLIEREITSIYDHAEQWVATAINGLSDRDEAALASSIRREVSDPEEAEDLLVEAVARAEALARTRAIEILDERIRQVYEAAGLPWRRPHDLHVEEHVAADGAPRLVLADDSATTWLEPLTEADVERLPEIVREYILATDYYAETYPELVEELRSA